MDKDKQIKEMSEDIMICLVEYEENDNIHTDYDVTAELLFEKGYRKQRIGKWVDLPDNGNGWYQNGQLIHPKRCSLCGDVYSRSYAYCPSCGAIMENN